MRRVGTVRFLFGEPRDVADLLPVDQQHPARPVLVLGTASNIWVESIMLKMPRWQPIEAKPYVSNRIFESI